MPKGVVHFYIPQDVVGVHSLVASVREALKGRDLRVFFLTPDFSIAQEEGFLGLFLIGVSPTANGVKKARSLKGQLMAFGVPEGNAWFVLVGAGLPGGLESALVEEALGPFHALLPYDPTLLLQAELENKSIFNMDPRGRFARVLNDLATGIDDWETAHQGVSLVNPTADLTQKLEDEVILRLGKHAHQDDPGPFIDEEVQRFLSEKGEGAWRPELIAAIKQKMKDRLMGWGPLGPWFRDDSVNEIMVNGVGRFFIERDGRIFEEKPPFRREEELRWVIDRMASAAGRRVDFSSPLCDVRLKDGSRVNVVLPPLSLAGPLVTIRKFRPHLKTMQDLTDRGTLTPKEAQVLWQAVRDRKNIVIAGNAGAGKTTLLNVLSGAIPPEERVITLEDTAELHLEHPHVLSLEARQKNTEGEGEISLNDLVLNALRMRPDRLIIGECRGLEVLSLLQAMNTGHDGALTTLHANSAADAIQRLEGMILLGAPRWPIEVVRQQIASAIDLIVFIKREEGRRLLKEIVSL